MFRRILGSLGRHPDRACVYTCLFGGYEEILEQPQASSSSLDFICFTDDPGLESETWRVEVVTGQIPGDPQRSSRYPKVFPHEFLEGYGVSMYIDNAVLLRKPPEETIAALLPRGEVMGVVAHSFRETLEDEFAEVVKLGYDDPEVVMKQLEVYKEAHLNVLAMKPLIGGVLIREHFDPRVIDTMTVWWEHLISYSRRDQLSFSVAIEESGLEPTVNQIDIRDNDFWEWPASKGRKRRKYG